jgi:hypothetical protein
MLTFLPFGIFGVAIDGAGVLSNCIFELFSFAQTVVLKLLMVNNSLRWWLWCLLLAVISLTKDLFGCDLDLGR